MFFVVMDMLTRTSGNGNDYISKIWEIAILTTDGFVVHNN